ncbi:MAG: YicC family protein [Candidatus Omnitrophica bacterium]|nr:YicC family protein [Candidatus Omnitrophota bacterium]
MIHSMTGYGKSSARSKHGTVTIEIRAVNHKFFELSAKIPNGLAQFEDKLKKIIQRSARRGKIYLNIELNGLKESTSAMILNRDMARQYQREFTKLKKLLKLKGDVRMDQLIMLPGIMVSETTKADYRRQMPLVTKALKKSLDELIKDRQQEGKALYRDLIKRKHNIQKVTKHINERSAVSTVRYKNRLIKKVRELTGAKTFDKGRLEQEVALFAKNCDISEEITRLRSHLSSFKKTLLSDAEVGKKLDFIAQELHREANTIASKSSDFKISRGVIQIKSDIEKIREQVKNIE